MQIDILIAVKPQEVREAISTLTSVVLDCDVECRLAVLMHGGTRKNFEELDAHLAPAECWDENDRKKDFFFEIEHERKTLSPNRLLTQLGEMKRNKLAALVWPGLAMNDPKWFGKVQQTFIKDPRNMLTMVRPFVNSSMHPMRLPSQIESDGHMIMGGLDFPVILASCINGQANFGRDLAMITKKLGGNRWLIESVRHLFIECLDQSESKANVFE